ncbi:hypothetical protein MHYP_G00315480 [Metynnis hypsauchen]
MFSIFLPDFGKLKEKAKELSSASAFTPMQTLLPFQLRPTLHSNNALSKGADKWRVTPSLGIKFTVLPYHPGDRSRWQKLPDRCNWCKHVLHTKYLDFGAGEEKLQFCSTKCLNQYKMDIFYREARAALITTSADSSPSHLDKESQPATGESQTLLTPESWDSSLEGERKGPSPKEAPTPVMSSAASVLRSSLSTLMKGPVPAQHQKEQEILGSSQLHNGQPAPCLAVDQTWVLQNLPSFFRPSLRAQSLHNSIHQPPHNPTSSPIHLITIHHTMST